MMYLCKFNCSIVKKKENALRQFSGEGHFRERVIFGRESLLGEGHFREGVIFRRE